MGLLSRPKDMTDLESILEKNTDVRYAERWHPYSVGRYEEILTRGLFAGMNKELRKNIVYSLQYIQFLQMEFEEIHWHDVLATQIIKTYVITAMSIIEGVFHHLIVSKGYQKKIDWKDIESPRHTKVAQQASVAVNTVYTGSQGAVDNQPRSVKCPNCGATNTIVPGAKNECEYCGSPL